MNHPSTFLDDLRATQQRQRATLEWVLSSMVETPFRLRQGTPVDASELQVRLVAADLLGPHTAELDAFELAQARWATRDLMRHVDPRVRWADTASDSLMDRLKPSGREDWVDTSDRAGQDKAKLLRDALALFQTADLIAQQD